MMDIPFGLTAEGYEMQFGVVSGTKPTDLVQTEAHKQLMSLTTKYPMSPFSSVEPPWSLYPYARTYSLAPRWSSGPYRRSVLWSNVFFRPD